MPVTRPYIVRVSREDPDSGLWVEVGRFDILPGDSVPEHLVGFAVKKAIERAEGLWGPVVERKVA